MTDDIQFRSTIPFKLKDKPKRQFQAIHLKKQFGFLPEVIVVEKLKRYNNVFIVRAVLTKEEMEKEAKIKSLDLKNGKPNTEKEESK